MPVLSLEQSPRYLLLGIAVILVAALLELTWSAYLSYHYQSPTPSITVPSAASQTGYQSNFITDSQLFGNATLRSAGNIKRVLPTTELQLVLRGAFSSSNPDLVSAMIEGPLQQLRSFKLNSVVFDDARLHQVFNDRVVLSRNGQLETLFFPIANSKSLATSSPVAQPSAGSTTNTTRPAAKQNMTAEQRSQLIRKRLLDLRNRPRDNPK